MIMNFFVHLEINNYFKIHHYFKQNTVNLVIQHNILLKNVHNFIIFLQKNFLLKNILLMNYKKENFIKEDQEKK